MSKIEILRELAQMKQYKDEYSIEELNEILPILKIEDDLLPLMRNPQNAQWEDASGAIWDIEGYGYDLGNNRILLWTHTDEAGISDITIKEKELNSNIEEIREYIHNIADNI